MYVGLRKDHNHRLISYPYYSKFQKAGDSTFFRHIDLNMPRLQADFRGANIIQGSVFLNNEDENSSTVQIRCQRQTLEKQLFLQEKQE